MMSERLESPNARPAIAGNSDQNKRPVIRLLVFTLGFLIFWIGHLVASYSYEQNLKVLRETPSMAVRLVEIGLPILVLIAGLSWVVRALPMRDSQSGGLRMGRIVAVAGIVAILAATAFAIGAALLLAVSIGVPR
jgi:hypothetical protein